MIYSKHCSVKLSNLEWLLVLICQRAIFLADYEHCSGKSLNKNDLLCVVNIKTIKGREYDTSKI